MRMSIRAEPIGLPSAHDQQRRYLWNLSTCFTFCPRQRLEHKRHASLGRKLEYVDILNRHHDEDERSW